MDEDKDREETDEEEAKEEEGEMEEEQEIRMIEEVRKKPAEDWETTLESSENTPKMKAIRHHEEDALENISLNMPFKHIPETCP